MREGHYAFDVMAFGVAGVGGVRTGLSRRQLLIGMGALAVRSAHGQARVHRQPKPLPKGAVTHDWPAFLGPSHNAVSTETMLRRKLPPPLVWEFRQGDRIRVAGHRGGTPPAPASLEERGNRRVSAPGYGVEALAVSICDRLQGPVRV